ncbi:phage regulatory CII family protein [Yersinia ruckeri]|nr:phage regulatory CII family protein [Yersinia ruckeri]EKN4693355.1 phage regulatory CII family protein [Yersinia ruckeri]
MFAKGSDKHTHWDSALRRFADAMDIKQVAESIAMNPQTLRNKLNPAQPHELTTIEMIRITHATGDCTLLDGALAQLGRLPSMRVDGQSSQQNLPERVLQITAATGELAGETVRLMAGNRLTKNRKDAIVARANRAVRDLMMFAYAVEERFHSVPVLSTAVDLIHSGSFPSLT